MCNLQRSTLGRILTVGPGRRGMQTFNTQAGAPDADSKPGQQAAVDATAVGPHGEGTDVLFYTKRLGFNDILVCLASACIASLLMSVNSLINGSCSRCLMVRPRRVPDSSMETLVPNAWAGTSR